MVQDVTSKSASNQDSGYVLDFVKCMDGERTSESHGDEINLIPVRTRELSC